MTCTSDFSPTFQAQNPAISGYRYGWESCAAFVGAMAHDYATCGLNHVTGQQVRNLTNEPIPDPKSPGLTIYQVAAALARLNVPVTPFLRMSWSTVESLLASGHYVSLCVAYSVIRPTRFSGDPNFYGGHQIGVPPGFEVQDPLCDGRRAGIYKYHHEPYPVDLVKRAAGAFRVTINGVPSNLGYGWAQGFYTAPHPNPIPTPPVPGGDMSIATSGITLSSKYVIDLPAGQVFYATPSTDHPLTKLSVAAAPFFTGNVVGVGWRAVQINTGAPYPDGVSRATQVYIPYLATQTPRKLP